MENSHNIENIIQDFKLNNYEFHCPECLQYALFGIKNEDNKIYIQYKCRNHNGEKLIEDFMNTQKYSINNLCCYDCGNIKDIDYYCFECEKSYCKNCESKDKKNNKHNKILKKKIIIKSVQNILNIIDYIVKHVISFYVTIVAIIILNMN